MTRRILYQFAAGLILSFLVGALFSGVLTSLGNVGLGGDKGGILFGIFLGLPVGSLLGIFLVDEGLFRLKQKNFLGGFLGFILSSVSGVESLIILDELGTVGIILAPAISTLLALVGYWVPLIRKRKSRIQGRP
jgi:hypothetical protein